MRNKIIATLIISLILTQSSYARIVSGDTDYKRRTNEEWVLKKDVLDYFDDLQNWLERESKVELLRKVASRSNAHGYYSEKETDWDDLYNDTMNRKATRSYIH